MNSYCFDLSITGFLDQRQDLALVRTLFELISRPVSADPASWSCGFEADKNNLFGSLQNGVVLDLQLSPALTEYELRLAKQP